LSHNPSSATTRIVESVDELGTDLAGRHKFTVSSGATIDPAVVDADLVAVERDGYLILEGLLTAAACEEIKAAVSPLLNRTGRNSFEGLRTQRLYNVLTKTRVCDALVEHPRILALLDRLFLPNYCSPSYKSSTSTPVSRPSCCTTTTACTPSPGLDHH
jgi:hypothetical protein